MKSTKWIVIDPDTRVSICKNLKELQYALDLEKIDISGDTDDMYNYLNDMINIEDYQVIEVSGDSISVKHIDVTLSCELSVSVCKS